MPEGDTVLRTARRLDAALAGSRLTRAELRWGERSADGLLGAVTLEVVARGKHLLHRVEGGLTLHSHLRMEGSWRVVATPRLLPRELGSDQVRAVVGTDAWTCLGLRLGMLDLLPTADEARLVGHLGPDILGADWDEATAVAALTRSPGTIAEALLDQRNLAGIGTLYASESLFLQRLHPWTPAAEVDRDVLTALVRRARRLMVGNLDHAVQATTGSRRRGEETYVHGRSGRPCRRCGALVRVAAIGSPPRDRPFFSCPGCQGGSAPTDDGRPQGPLGSGRRSFGTDPRGR